MAYIQPNSDIVLFKNIKLDSSYENTIYFASRAAQEAYFFSSSHVLQTLTAYSYRRTKSNTVKVKLPVSVVEQCTYLAFNNKSYENKWFYCFVDDFNYVNDNTTEIEYHIDLIQTYFIADCELLKCYVLREHAMDDTVGANRVPEPVGSDHVMYTEKWRCNSMEHYSVVVTASSTNPSSYSGEFFRQGMFNGMEVLTYPLSNDAEVFSEADDIMAELEDMLGDGNYVDPTTGTNKQQVVSIIMFPTAFCADNNSGTPVITIEGNFSKTRTSIGSYTPKNNKLLTAPYKSLLLTNGIGGVVTLDYDDFGGQTDYINFKLWGSCTGSGEMICIPQWYKGVEDNMDYKLMINGFPQCAYTLDAYRAWIAGGGQKYQKLGVLNGIAKGLSTGFRIGQSFIRGNFGDAYNKLQNSMQAGKSFQDAAKASDALELSRINTAMENADTAGSLAGNIYNTAVNYLTTEYETGNMVNVPAGEQSSSCLVAQRKLNFVCYELNIIEQDAQRIDDFFSLYGYATNKIKIPNINGRPQWNFIQTQGCTLAGNVPATIRSAIEQIFDSGIRFWKNGDSIGNYDLINK